MTRDSANRGIWVFCLIWLGQLISIVGSGLTEFALGVWVYQRSGVATEFALVVFFITLPQVVVSPLAGALVDRWDRRLVMILSDTGAALCSLTVALLAWTGTLEVWHVYVAVLATSTCGAFQFPAYATLVTRLVPKQQLGRANGMVEIAWSAGLIASPLLAAVLLGLIALHGVILVDVATFVVGVSALLIARVPRSETTAGSAARDGSLLRETAYGWRFIAARPGLSGLLAFFAIMNFGMGLFNALLAPMVLSFAPAEALGTLVSIGGAGLLLGGLAMTAWGGPTRRVRAILLLGPLFGLCILAIGLRPSVPVIAAANFLFIFCQPFINASDQAIWQTKVALDVQGRVFATRRAIEHACGLLAYLVAGPLADGLFGPLLAPDGPLAPTVGTVIGVGPGRGIGLLFVLIGLATVVASTWASASPRVRLLEDELPDAVADDAPAPRLIGELQPAA